MRLTVCSAACLLLIGTALPVSAAAPVPPPVSFVASGTVPIKGSFFLGDVTGDGDPDLITGSAVYVGGAGATFRKGPVVTVTGAQALGDVNGDSRNDLIAVDAEAETARVAYGTGRGTFQGGAAVSVSAGVFRRDAGPIVVADFNGDRHPDLAVARNQSGFIAVFLGSAGGVFSRSSGVALTADRYINAFDAADVDRDGSLDIVAESNGDSGDAHTVALIRGNGDGTFQPPQRILGPGAEGPQTGDFNADGNPDVAYRRRDDLMIGRGDGHGGFQSTVAATAPVAASPAWYARAAGDVDGDHRTDIVAAPRWNDLPVLLLSQVPADMACTTDGGSVTVPAGGTVRTGNPTLLPAANVTFTGTGPTRTMTVRPVAGRSGGAAVAVTLPDGRVLSFTVQAGTTGDNTITGSGGRDLIFPGNGQDSVATLGGDDLVCDAGGDDRINTGAGNDVASGGSGGDTILTEAGADTLLGGTGDDTLTGGPGADRFSGGVGLDTTDLTPAQGDTQDGTIP